MSPDYHNLCRRLSQLRRNLKPKHNPTGSYSDAEYDQTRGWIALIHAEIEHYLEKRCAEIAERAFNEWVSNRTVNRVVFSLYAMCYSGWEALSGEIDPSELPKTSKQNDLNIRIASAKKQYEHVISNNHGIKEENLKRLLIPLSLQVGTNPASTWCAEMSNFGGVRGSIVHTSSWRAKNSPDPEAISKVLVDDLLPGLKSLDNLLEGLVLKPVSIPSQPSQQGFISRFFKWLKALLKFSS